MGVEVDRQADLLLQRRDQALGRFGLAEARHVLDRNDVGTRRLQLFGEANVVGEIVTARRVGEIAGVADGGLAELALLEHRVHRQAHVLDPVEAIEDTKEVDTRFGRLLDEVANHIIGVVLVADTVGTAQQHLQQDVRDRLADGRQALPGVFLQEAHGDVEGGAAPALQRQKVGQEPRVVGRHLEHVVAAHAGRDQGLMRVTKGGVGDQRAWFGQHPLSELLRSQLRQTLPAAR